MILILHVLCFEIFRQIEVSYLEIISELCDFTKFSILIINFKFDGNLEENRSRVNRGHSRT